MNYEAFLSAKLIAAEDHGISANGLHPRLFPWQADVVRWALRKGRAAIFADTGLGKTLMQLEWARHVPGRVFILAPLAVASQTVREASTIGMEISYVRSQEEADAAGQVVITNYEMLEAFDPGVFHGVVLDESSILKSFTGKTKRALLEAFAATPFRLACTATPAPNDHMELGNHAAFLGVMASNEMLARWFINDSMHAGIYRLKRHAEADFWRWVSSWAMCAGLPSDLGDYSDEGYMLPPLQIEHHVVTDPERAHDRGQLFMGSDDLSATQMWRDKAETADARSRLAAEIVATKSETPWVVWCETNHEADLLRRLISEAVEVRGNESIATKEAKLDAFSSGRARIIVTKPGIAGFGLNWQHASDVVFVGMTYSFERLYQAIRRCWRFRQTKPVTVHLISAESDTGIVAALWRKKDDHERMQRAMADATRRWGLRSGPDRRLLSAVEEKTFTGEDWTLHLGDNVPWTRKLPDDSIDLSVFSPPFSNLYIYSDSIADMGNAAGHEEFFEHMGFLVPELYRVLRPGRLVCVHCKDLPLYMNRDGAAGLYDFPGDLVDAFEAAGFTFHSRITIWKDPVTEMQRTKNHGLLHKNFTERGEVCRQGMADYVLVFRAWKGEVPDKQIQRQAKPGEYVGENPPRAWEDDRDYSIQLWQRYASPVWFDVRQPRVLNYANARDPEDEKHICPLQLDVIERCIYLWSNPGEIVLDPFAGIGSTGYVALETDRQFVGIELKRRYADQAVKHLERALLARRQATLL